MSEEKTIRLSVIEMAAVLLVCAVGIVATSKIAKHEGALIGMAVGFAIAAAAIAWAYRKHRQRSVLPTSIEPATVEREVIWHEPVSPGLAPETVVTRGVAEAADTPAAGTEVAGGTAQDTPAPPQVSRPAQQAPVQPGAPQVASHSTGLTNWPVPDRTPAEHDTDGPWQSGSNPSLR